MYVFVFGIILEERRWPRHVLFFQCDSVQGIVAGKIVPDTLALMDSNGRQLSMPKDKNKDLNNLVWFTLYVAL